MQYRSGAIHELEARLKAIFKQNSSSIHLSRLMLLLLFIVKELATARLAMFQKTLRNVANSLSQAIYAVYSSLSTAWLSFLQFGGDDGLVSIFLPLIRVWGLL